MGRLCAVYGCKNAQSKTREQGIRYYRFSTLPWMQEKVKHWIAFANRQTVDGKPWAPTNSSRICSAHFVGGVKGEHPRKPNYYPTIYPAQIFTNTNNQDQVQPKSKLSKTVKTATKKTTSMKLDPRTLATTITLEIAGLKTNQPQKFSKKKVTVLPAPTTSNPMTSICSANPDVQTQAVEPAPIIIPNDEAPRGIPIRNRKLKGPHVHDCIICGSTKSCSQIDETHQKKWSANICSLYNVQETDGVPTRDKMKDIIQVATYCKECLEDLENIEKINGQIKRAQTQLHKIKVKYQTKLKDFLRLSLKKQSREDNDDEVPAEHTLEFQAKRKREILFEYMHGAPITQFIGRRWSKNCVTVRQIPDLLQNENPDPKFEALDSGAEEISHEPEDTLMDYNEISFVDVNPNVNISSNSPLAKPHIQNKKVPTKTSSNVSLPSNISTPQQPSKPLVPEETDSAKTALLLRQHKIKDFSINVVNLALPTKSGSISIRTKRISSKVLAEQVIIRKSKPTQMVSSIKIPNPNSHLYKRSTYKCPLTTCAKTYIRLKDFQKHMKYGVHEGDSPGFPCTEPECFGKTSFRTQRGLALHQRQFHMIDISAPKYVLCETCGTSYVAKKRHLHVKSTAHNRKEGDGHLRCKFCALTFSNLKVFREHRATHPEFHAQRKESELLCQYCSKKFYKKWALKDHEMLHTKNFPHLCHICAFGTAQKSTLKTHLLGKHGVPLETLKVAGTDTVTGWEPEPERHECPICKKTFTSLKQFKTHTQFDNGDKKIFTCKLCLMEFCNHKDYVRHEYYHNKPRKPVVHCPVCNRMFALEKNVKIHMDREHPPTSTATATVKSD